MSWFYVHKWVGWMWQNWNIKVHCNGQLWWWILSTKLSFSKFNYLCTVQVINTFFWFRSNHVVWWEIDVYFKLKHVLSNKYWVWKYIFGSELKWIWGDFSITIRKITNIVRNSFYQQFLPIFLFWYTKHSPQQFYAYYSNLTTMK